MAGLRFVGRNHAVRDPDLVGERALGATRFLAQALSGAERLTLSVTSCAGLAPPAVTFGSGETIWMDDALPAGTGFSDGIQWSTAQKVSGTQSNELAAATGMHQSYFAQAPGFWINEREVLFAYVLLDPCNPPREVMLQWHSNNWDHRAYWGENAYTTVGTNNTPSRRPMGALPPTGQWIRLEVPASLVSVSNAHASGFAMTFVDGHGWFDRVGKTSCTTPVAAAPSSFPSTDVVWIDDALPTGASSNVVWDTTQKASGTQSRTNPINTGSVISNHWIAGATQTMRPGVGDKIFAYVLLDPCAPPSEVMLEFNTGGWGNRAYWGADEILTTPRTRIGELPPAGQWVRLEVPAATVGLENVTISGIASDSTQGKVWWDRVGIAPASGAALRHASPTLVGDAGLPSRRARMWAWVKRRFRREPEPPPVSFSILAQVMDAGETKQRYSLYTPELNLMAETTASTTTPAIAYEYVWFGGEPLAQIETDEHRPLVLQRPPRRTAAYHEQHRGNRLARGARAVRKPLRTSGRRSPSGARLAGTGGGRVARAAIQHL